MYTLSLLINERDINEIPIRQMLSTFLSITYENVKWIKIFN